MNLRKMSLLYKFQILYLTLAFSIPVSVNCVDAPSVIIPNEGIIVGKFIKMFRTQNIKAYLGIKYAQAERFSPPTLINTKFTTILNATKIGPTCWQNRKTMIDSQNEVILNLLNNQKYDSTFFDEDCLYLNIYIPDGIPGLNGYAVVVWFHSGDFSNGNAFDADPFQLVYKQNIIVVTVSYRLNIFGFLSTIDGEAQGNFGLMDQSAALFWINQRIHFFGGDTNKITIMGHSAGSISVGLHLTSGKWSSGAFTKAIMMSGNPLRDNAVRLPTDNEYFLDIIANTFGCVRRPSSLLIKCLKRIDAKVIADNLPNLAWCPVVDFGLSNTSEAFIQRHPRLMLQSGNFHKVPLLVGVTDLEEIEMSTNGKDKEKEAEVNIDDFLKAQYFNDVERLLDTYEPCNTSEIGHEALSFLYKNMDSFNQNSLPTIVKYQNDRYNLAPFFEFLDIFSLSETIFAYIFTYKPKTDILDNNQDGMNMTRKVDQLFVWGVPYKQNTFPATKEWSSPDKKISDVIMTLWANFAKASNPTLANIYIKWSPYEQQNQSVLLIDKSFSLTNASKPKNVEFWINFYPKLVEFAVECCVLARNIASNSIPDKRFFTFLIIWFSYFYRQI